MKRTSLTLLTAFLLLVAVGCAASGQSRERSDPDRITQEEIEASGVLGSAYSLVRNLRPLWLRKRGRHSINYEGDIWVYVDGTRFGAPEALDQISVMNVSSLEFLDAAAATNRYGIGHDHGAILVHMRRQ